MAERGEKVAGIALGVALALGIYLPPVTLAEHMGNAAVLGDRSGAILPALHAYLQERGIPAEVRAEVQAENLALPALPPAHATLRVSGGRWDGLRREFQFYFRCADAQVCRPFLVRFRSDHDKTISALRGLTPGSLRPVASEGVEKAQRSPPGEPLVNAGDRAAVVVTGPGLRIRLMAVCLERGSLGQRIRVRGVGDRKVFLAQVVGPGQLATEVR